MYANPEAPQPQPQPGTRPPTNQGTVTLLYLVAGVLALGVLAFTVDAARHHDDQPVPLEGSSEGALRNGRWVTVEAMVEPGSLGQFSGRIFSSPTWGLQVEGHSVVVITSETFTPWLSGQGSVGGRWVAPFSRALKAAEERQREAGAQPTAQEGDGVDRAPLIEALSRPQRFTGVIFHPSSSGEFEYFETKLKLDSYCSSEGAHCGSPRVVLLTEQKPRSRAVAAASAVGCAFGLLVLFVLRQRSRRRPAA